MHAKLRIKSRKKLTPKPLSEIEADGLGVSFFGLYPQLCVCCSYSMLRPYYNETRGGGGQKKTRPQGRGGGCWLLDNPGV